MAWSQGDLESAETQSCQEPAGRRLEGRGLRAGMGSQAQAGPKEAVGE